MCTNSIEILILVEVAVECEVDPTDFVDEETEILYLVVEEEIFIIEIVFQIISTIQTKQVHRKCLDFSIEIINNIEEEAEDEDECLIQDEIHQHQDRTMIDIVIQVQKAIQMINNLHLY